MIGNLPQTCTYWGAPLPNGFGGFTFAAPVSLACRWEEIAEQFTNNQGELLVSKAKVYLNVDVHIGGYLFLGSSVVSNPTTIASYPIRQFSKIPDLRAVIFERIAFL